MIANGALIGAVVGAVVWLIPFVMLFIIPVNRKPSSATAWLLLLFALPLFGLLIYLLIGNPKLPKRRREQQRTMDRSIGKTVAMIAQQPHLSPVYAPTIAQRYEPFVRLNASLGDMPAWGGNTIELLPEYNAAIARIAEEIDRAEKFVHVEYFALSRDEETECVFAALERAQKRGVKVRVLMDYMGSHKYPNYKSMCEQLTAAGIEHYAMLPIHLLGSKATRPDLRNHRKIVVIDGAIGFTGSQNMIKRNYFRKDAIYYDELVARVSGPVAGQLNAAFITDWYGESGIQLTGDNAPEIQVLPPASGDVLCQVLPSGSGFDNENNLKLFTALIHAARHTLVVTNPYFVPDDALMTAITSAAQRGVDVTLINSEAADQFMVSHAQRSYYEQLLQAGVKIRWYHAPILLHSKFMTVDDDMAVIGSSNMDLRSFELNMEVTLVVYEATVVAALHEIEADYLAKTRPVLLGEWQRRGTRTRLAENLCRLTAALQ